MGLAVAGLILGSPTARAFTTIQFDYTGDAQIWTVPPDVFSATFSVFGAEGGGGRNLPSPGESVFSPCGSVLNDGGLGGETIGKLTLTPGQKLTIEVGGKGGTSPCFKDLGGPGGAGGFGGGGKGGATIGSSTMSEGLPGGGGGGSSSVRLPDGLVPVIVAGGGGGGGGGGHGGVCKGAHGGGTIADAGNPCQGGGGGGGSQSEGGWGGPGNGGNATPGSFRQGGNGGGTNTGAPHTYTAGGGGGGGWYGGGGGGGADSIDGGGGGGGGSNLGPNGSIHIKGINAGHGRVVIVYEFGSSPPEEEQPPPTEGEGHVLCSPSSIRQAPVPRPTPPGGQRTAQQETTASVCEAERDPGRPRTEPGVLGIAVAKERVAFGQIPRGQTSEPIAVGRIYYTNTLGTRNPWSATVASTKLSNGTTSIPFTGMSFVPGQDIEPNSGATGTLTAANGGKFTGSPANNFSNPMSLMTAPGDAAGAHTHLDTTASLFVPSDTPTKSYTGTLQYTITG